LYRYDEVGEMSLLTGAPRSADVRAGPEVGGCTAVESIRPIALASARLQQPLILECDDFLVFRFPGFTKIAFHKWVNLCRYAEGAEAVELTKRGLEHVLANNPKMQAAVAYVVATRQLCAAGRLNPSAALSTKYFKCDSYDAGKAEAAAIGLVGERALQTVAVGLYKLNSVDP
jgi:hypothetical protein